MILSNLKNLFRELQLNKESYYLFDFRKNNIRFEILFDIFNSPYKLHFLQKENNFSFCLDVKKGFIIDEFLDKKTYKQLCEVLKLKFDSQNPFSPKSFFEEFHLKIPFYENKVKKERELYIFYKDSIEESEKLYYDGNIQWNKINIRKKVSEKNLEKTRILYPELYEWSKRENISIRYTHIKKNDEKELIQILKKDIA